MRRDKAKKWSQKSHVLAAVQCAKAEREMYVEKAKKVRAIVAELRLEFQATPALKTRVDKILKDVRAAQKQIVMSQVCHVAWYGGATHIYSMYSSKLMTSHSLKLQRAGLAANYWMACWEKNGAKFLNIAQGKKKNK